MRALARAAVRLALLAYPPRFRARFAESIEDTFQCGLRARARDGRIAAAAYGIYAVAELVLSGLRERRAPALRDTRPMAARGRPTLWTRFGLFVKDARLAARAFARRPGFTAVAVMTLALGIGASTAIFSIVHAVLLEPLPYAEPERIFTISALWSGPEAGIGAMSQPDLADIAARAESIDTLVGVGESSATLTGLGEPEVTRVARLTTGLLSTFLLSPVLGRDLRADEFGAEGPAVAVIGHAFWQSRFGGDPAVVGQALTLSGVRYEIVGVAPAGFDYPNGAPIWIPRRMNVEDCGRGCHSMYGVGRTSADTDIERVQADLDVLAGQLREQYPETNTHKSFYVRSLQEQIVGDVSRGLWVLLGAVGLVVLIACANVANLLLARASARVGETAIRAAMGASRLRLATQTLLESALLSSLGGICGLGVAALILSVLSRVATGIPRIENVGLDGAVLAFSLAVAAAAALGFGLVPTWFQEGLRGPRGLEQATGRAGGRRDRRLQGLLLTTETALAVVLLVAAGLLFRSFGALYAVDLGYDPDDLLRFSVILPETPPQSLAELRGFYGELEQRVAALPGVESVGYVWGPPLGRGRATGTVLVSGRPAPPPEEEREAEVHSVSPGWLATMRARIIQGRGLTELDDRSEANAAVVNATFVREHFPDEDPIGRRVKVSVSVGHGSPTWTIVGVVDDMRWRGLALAPEAQIIVPHGRFGPENMTITVRTKPGVVIGLPALQTIVRELGPDVPIYRLETMDAAVARQVAPTRFYLVLIGGFALLAAVLAAVGLYGVASYAAARRRFEIGLRYALGARRESILKLVVAQGMAPAAVGVTVGLVVAFFGSRVMESILYGVEARDPWIYGIASFALLAIAFGATAAPAWRAARVDPAGALRAE